jgi:hypothetical protein
MFTAHLLKHLGWEIDHDNKWQFCPCPGSHGSVSHAFAFADSPNCQIADFAPKLDHMFRHVGHQTREPLGYVNSRSKAGTVKYIQEIACAIVLPEDAAARRRTHHGSPTLALYKWVQQNTFVRAVSDFHYKIEDSYVQPHEMVTDICNKCGLSRISRLNNSQNNKHERKWRVQNRASAQRIQDKKLLAMQEMQDGGGHAPAADTTDTTATTSTSTTTQHAESSCPLHSEVLDVLKTLDPTENHDHTKHGNYSWKELWDLDPDMTTLAILVGREYGYTIADVEPTAGFKVRCGFSNDPVLDTVGWGERVRGFKTWLPRHTKSMNVSGTLVHKSPKWMCVLDRGKGG